VQNDDINLHDVGQSTAELGGERITDQIIKSNLEQNKQYNLNFLKSIQKSVEAEKYKKLRKILLGADAARKESISVVLSEYRDSNDLKQLIEDIDTILDL